jgi:predicted dehydrogenase
MAKQPNISTPKKKVTRRSFIATAAAAPAIFHIVPAHCLGGPKHTAPSDTFGAALIGAGGRGPATYKSLTGMHKLKIRDIAKCDVKYKGKENNKDIYSDYRRLLERKDLDIVAIATPPHWHALISIAAMQAGKDVLCEKPMTRFIGEGRVVADAAQRYGRIYQVGTYGRFRHHTREKSRENRKIILAGMAEGKGVRWALRGGVKVRQWSGPVNIKPREVPSHLNWDLYCGPSPHRPFHPPRFGGMHRGYWDYDGGGLGDMGQHKLDPITYLYGKDNTAPVKVEPHAPPSHPDMTGMWGWVKMTYADGVEFVLQSNEWGKAPEVHSKMISAKDLSAEEQAKLKALPDPERLIGFGEAVKTRQQAGGNAEAAHRTVCIMHLANIAVRTGRTLNFDPDTEQIIGDEEANRLAHQPMRDPWSL